VPGTVGCIVGIPVGNLGTVGCAIGNLGTIGCAIGILEADGANPGIIPIVGATGRTGAFVVLCDFLQYPCPTFSPVL